jgi:hypothetical protein
MFNLAIDSKLRGCDVVAIRVEDVAASGYTADRATVRQRLTRNTGKQQLKGRPMMSMNTEAGPSPPARSPSMTCTSNVSLSPSSFGLFSTTTASLTDDASLLNTER